MPPISHRAHRNHMGNIADSQHTQAVFNTERRYPMHTPRTSALCAVLLPIFLAGLLSFPAVLRAQTPPLYAVVPTEAQTGAAVPGSWPASATANGGA